MYGDFYLHLLHMKLEKPVPKSVYIRPNNILIVYLWFLSSWSMLDQCFQFIQNLVPFNESFRRHSIEINKKANFEVIFLWFILDTIQLHCY